MLSCRCLLFLLPILGLSLLPTVTSYQQTTVIRKYPFSENCSTTDRLAIIQCEESARSIWNVDDSTYYTSSRSFCCFVWDTLSCALETAQGCDTVYATELTLVTEQTLHSLCNYSAGSSSCAIPAWSWWPLVPILIGCLSFCFLVLFLAYPKEAHRRKLRTKSTLSQFDEEMAESAI